MEYVKLGNTGLEVSRICLGTMGFGDPSSGYHQWVVDETQSREVIKRALDLGINFFDTALSLLSNVCKMYSNNGINPQNKSTSFTHINNSCPL